MIIIIMMIMIMVEAHQVVGNYFLNNKIYLYFNKKKIINFF